MWERFVLQETLQLARLATHFCVLHYQYISYTYHKYCCKCANTICYISQVIEYLSKKGYNRTEAMLRQESANLDAQGRVIATRVEDRGGQKYFVAWSEL